MSGVNFVTSFMAPIPSKTDSSLNIKQRRESDLNVKYYDRVQETEVRAPEYDVRQYAESAVAVDWPRRGMKIYRRFGKACILIHFCRWTMFTVG
jgi:hypothetical protein